MRRFIAALAATLFSTSLLADAFSIPPSGQLPGTATNDNATVGNVGEYIRASGTLISNTGTITIATPAVVTYSVATPFSFTGSGCWAVNFTTTGALPTGITAATNYYVISSSVSGNSFQIATSCANAVAGTAVATSGTQSGTHTVRSGATLANNVVATVGGVNLSAGDWEVTCRLIYRTAASTVITSLLTSIVNAPSTSNGYWTFGNTTPGVADNTIVAGPTRVSLNATTLQTCATFDAFTTSTLDAWGEMTALRVR